MTERKIDPETEVTRGQRLQALGRRRPAKLLAVVGLTAVGSLAVGGVAGASAVESSHAPRTALTATTATAATGATGATRATAATGATAATHHHPNGRGPLIKHLLRGTLHAEFVLRTKAGTTQTFVLDRGVVRSVTSTTITIAPADTPSATVSATVTSKTRFPGLPESQLKSGDKVVLVVHGGDAVMVGSRPARPGSSGSNSPTAGPSTSNGPSAS